METKCCGTCKWHKCEMDDSWICVNRDSEYCADWTDYDHCCKEWKKRRNFGEHYLQTEGRGGAYRGQPAGGNGTEDWR